MLELASHIALSSQMVLQRDFEMTTNNIANIKTGGFERALSPHSEAKVNPQFGKNYSYVQDLAVVRDLSPGAFQKTGDPFHVYANGGYFSVETPEGVRYTKNGAFTLNEEGVIVTAWGDPVLDTNNAPIILPEGSFDIKIASDGTISTPDGVIAQLGLFNFANPYDRQERENTLFETNQPPIEVADPKITQGGYDGGNVNAVLETAKLSSLLRQIQHTQKVIEAHSHLEESATQRLLKVPSAA